MMEERGDEMRGVVVYPPRRVRTRALQNHRFLVNRDPPPSVGVPCRRKVRLFLSSGR